MKRPVLKPLPLLLALAVTASCSTYYDPCFPTESLVSDLRILAVRADPPEALYDPGQDPPPVNVQALVVHPDPLYPRFEVRARLCVPPAVAGPCPDGTPIVRRGFGRQDQPPVLKIQVARTLLEAARAADTLKGYGGVRVQLDLEVPSSTTSVFATKILLFSPRTPDAQPNHGLELTALTVLVPDSFAQELQPGGGVSLEVGTNVGLVPRIGPGPGGTEAAEEYVTTDLSGATVHLRERISYSFFTTPHLQYGPAGNPKAGADQADEPAPGATAPPHGLTQMVALSQNNGRFWVVARDGRGGVAWGMFSFVSVDNRTCVNPVDEGGVTNHCANLEISCG